MQTEVLVNVYAMFPAAYKRYKSAQESFKIFSKMLPKDPLAMLLLLKTFRTLELRTFAASQETPAPSHLLDHIHLPHLPHLHSQ